MAKNICNCLRELEPSYFLIIQLSLSSSSPSPAACADVTNAFSQSVLFRVHEGVNIVSGFLLEGLVVILFLAALVKKILVQKLDDV